MSREAELKEAVKSLLAVIDYLTITDGRGNRFNCWKEDRNLAPYVDQSINEARVLVKP